MIPLRSAYRTLEQWADALISELRKKESQERTGDDLTLHMQAEAAAHPASAISYAPAGSIVAQDVQAAITELDTEKSSTSHLHTGVYAVEMAAQDSLLSRIADSGFYESSTATEAEGWPVGADGSWWMLINAQHSNTGNNFALQISCDFHDINMLHARVTNGAGTNVWKKLWHDGNHNSTGDPHTQYALDTDLSAHLNDTTDAHNASAISVLDTAGRFASGDAEGCFAELAMGGTDLIYGPVSLSGLTQYTFTSIPSWVKKIQVVIHNLSTNGTSWPVIRVGSATDGVKSTGYVGGTYHYNGGAVWNTSGASLSGSTTATYVISGAVDIHKLNQVTFDCIFAGLMTHATPIAAVNSVCGNVPLAAVLDRVQISTVNGTDTFDGGTVTLICS